MHKDNLLLEIYQYFLNIFLEVLLKILKTNFLPKIYSLSTFLTNL